MRGSAVYEKKHRISVCVCLLLQYLLQSCSRGRGGIVEDMCYERRRAEACLCGLVCPSRTSEWGGREIVTVTV
jgi:hypothetical protein